MQRRKFEVAELISTISAPKRELAYDCVVLSDGLVVQMDGVIGE